jgi:hypothetical protein
MDYAEKLFRDWSNQEGLIPLFLIADFDQIGEPLRLWWFNLGDDLTSPLEGLCDDEVIIWFGAKHELTFVDRILIDQQSAF